jgi:Leucine-rich repeat (LRR) protein
VVLNYYIKKKIDNLKNTALNSLTESDIKLLNTPSLASLKMELKPRFTTQLGSQNIKSSKLEITYPNSILSKYISLYGFESLLDDLPDNLVHLGFENKSENYINIKLPNDISNLSNLQSLFLEKCVDSIPDSVGNLKNLIYLSLPNNPKLSNLPDSVYNLPSLKVLRVEGTNIQIPEKYSEMFKETRTGSNFWRKI